MALTVIPLSGLASDVVDSISAGAGGGGPRIANVQIANSSWGLLDDTAVSTDGGYVLINGSGFVSGCSVLVANSQATPVTFANSSLLRVEVPAKSASTYAVYVLNPDGGTAIGINALTYSAFPAWATGSTLSSGTVDAEISVQLSASDATTYTLQAGSSLPANTTLASNGLFSGTITGVNEETTYTFTVEATDAQNQNTPRTFSITITVGDSYFKSTTLLLNADANTYVRDASDNAFAITVNGDTRPSAFSPYNTNWSNYFDGNSDSLSFATSTALSLSGAFTIEFWIFLESLALDTINPSIITFPTQPNAWQVYVNSAGSYIGIYNGTSDVVNTTSSSITANRWYHVAISRDASSNMAIFLDGVRKGSTASGAGTIGSTTGTIYFMSYGNNTGDVKGYLSNLRIVKGNAVYDPTQTTLTVPTTALTAVSNTQLLTCQSNRIIDNSTNAFTITRNGDVKVTSFGPFTETDVTTGSGYFDGTDDNLITSSSSNLALGSGDFTIEMWVYPNNTSSAYRGLIASDAYSATTNGWTVYQYGTNIEMYYSSGGSTPNIFTASSVLVAGVWQHVAISRSSGTLKCFVNGVQVASVSNSIAFVGSIIYIGDNNAGNYFYSGYISDVRIVKGTAVYTSAFTPPTSPLTSVANTQLLTLQNRTGITNHQFVDESGINHLFTRGGNASQGSFSPYSPAGWSGYFDGTGDYLSVLDNAALELGSVSFTIECWFNISSSGTHTILSKNRSGTGAVGGFSLDVSSTTIRVYINGDNGTTLVPVITTTISLNVWNHIAIVRSVSGSTTNYVFLNGVSVGTSSTSTAIIDNSEPWWIGSTNLSGSTYNLFTGYISNLRIVKGTALYTSAFTPSATPLTPVANTSLLTLRGNGFTDDGPNRFAITRNGDVKIEPFSPFKSHTITANTHSVYFDGSGDYLQLADSTSWDLTGDFTIEMWIYKSSLSSQTFFLVGTAGSSTSILLYQNASNAIIFLTSSAVITSSTSAALNQWNHIALVRNGSGSNNITLYLNGLNVGQATNTTSFTGDASNGVRIGAEYPTGFEFLGYISNVRIVKGTAVYTSAFTPSTTPLTAISNTVLLTCQSTTIIDSSTNAFTITATGNATASKFNPFGETITQSVEYRANTHGGSVYFDGTSDSLITTTTVPAIGTGDFTIDAWVYLLSAPAVNGWIYGNRSGSATSGYLFISNSLVPVYGADTGSIDLTSSTAVKLATWNHIAVSRSGSTIRLFLNGILVASATNTNNYSYAGTQPVGYASSGNAYTLNGYISDLRVVLGTALYNSSFIPPSTTLSAVSGTVFLLNNDRGGIMDVSSRNVLECVGNARVSTDTKKYGTGSFYFDGTGDYLLPPPSQNFAFRTGDFTIELWIKTSSTADDGILQISTTAGGFATSYTNGLMLTSYLGTLYWALNGSSVNTSTTINDGNWHHIAMTRSGSTVRVFKNGTQISTATNAGDVQGTNLVIGGYYTTSYTLEGYIDDLRITKGVARYTTNFTAPTSAHQTK